MIINVFFLKIQNEFTFYLVARQNKSEHCVGIISLGVKQETASSVDPILLGVIGRLLGLEAFFQKQIVFVIVKIDFQGDALSLVDGNDQAVGRISLIQSAIGCGQMFYKSMHLSAVQLNRFCHFVVAKEKATHTRVIFAIV